MGRRPRSLFGFKASELKRVEANRIYPKEILYTVTPADDSLEDYSEYCFMESRDALAMNRALLVVEQQTPIFENWLEDYFSHNNMS